MCCTHKLASHRIELGFSQRLSQTTTMKVIPTLSLLITAWAKAGLGYPISSAGHGNIVYSADNRWLSGKRLGK